MSISFSATLRRDWLRLESIINSAEKGNFHPVLDGKSLTVSDVVAVSRFVPPVMNSV